MAVSVEGALKGPASKSLPDVRLGELASRCADAFQACVEHPDEAALLDAYEIGRQALADGVGVLDMARIVSSVIGAVATVPLTTSGPVLRAAEAFLVETLSPFEMAHRGFREANDVLRRMNDMLEGQTRDIAAALHDEASELLTPLHFTLKEIAVKAPAELADDLDRLGGMLTRVEERLRVLAHELRPPALDQFGLVPALELLVQATSLRHGIEVRLRADVDSPLPAIVDATVYRIVQEALNNIVKHSKASRAEITLLRNPRRMRCTISDNGIGLPACGSEPPAGIGLSGIRERVAGLGGSLQLSAGADNKGTTVAIDIPLEA